MNVNREVWILAEHREGELEDITFELASAGKRVADKLDGSLSAVIFSEQIADMTNRLTSHAISKIFIINDSSLREYTTEAYAETLSRLAQERRPEIILCGITPFCSDIAYGLAARLETGLITDCVSLDVNDDGLLAGEKTVYNERLQAKIICSSVKPHIATISPGVCDVRLPKPGNKAEVVTLTPEPFSAKRYARITGTVRADLKKIPLDQAEVIVSGGRGIGGPEGFDALEKLAELLGGCVGASLVACDNGWVPEDRHIGQTGLIVSPRLYLAVGISGSIYHAMGMKDSKYIVAINKDRNAPIFRLADLGIVGDWRETVNELTDHLTEIERDS